MAGPALTGRGRSLFELGIMTDCAVGGIGNDLKVFKSSMTLIALDHADAMT